MATSNVRTVPGLSAVVVNERLSSETFIIPAIKQMVATEFNMHPKALDGKNRQANVVLPRHIAMWLCRKLSKASVTRIGMMFGGRDHTSVVYALKKIDDALADGGATAAKIKRIENCIVQDGTYIARLLEVMEIVAPDFIELAYFAHGLDPKKTEKRIIAALAGVIKEAQLDDR